MIKKAKESAITTSQTSNRILKGTSIQGEVNSDGDFRVDGSMKGTININGKLVIGEKGVVEGDVKCGSANISGACQGTLHVEGLLSLEASANVKGDVFTSKLSVIPGAELSGTCSMGAVVRQMQNDAESTKEETEKRTERVS